MEFLKETLGDDLYGQFSAVMGEHPEIKLANVADGKYVPIDKFNAERANAKGLRTQIEELSAQIASLQENTTTTDALRGQLAQMSQEINRKNEELSGQRLAYSVLDAVRSHKARNPEVVAKLIDASTIVETEDGYENLTEQIEALKETYPYMFEVATPSNGGFDPSRVPNTTGVTENSVMNNMIRSAFKR